jgi:hypothetical protein
MACVLFLNKLFFKNYMPGAGGVVQMVKCLPRRCEALSSNPSTAKKKKIYMPVILALRRGRQEYCEFEATLVYIARSCLQQQMSVCVYW